MMTVELFCHFLTILYWKYKSIKKKNKSEKLNLQFIFMLITFRDLFKLAQDSQFNSKSLEAHQKSEESLSNGTGKQLELNNMYH